MKKQACIKTDQQLASLNHMGHMVVHFFEEKYIFFSHMLSHNFLCATSIKKKIILCNIVSESRSIYWSSPYRTTQIV